MLVKTNLNSLLAYFRVEIKPNFINKGKLINLTNQSHHDVSLIAVTELLITSLNLHQQQFHLLRKESNYRVQLLFIL